MLLISLWVLWVWMIRCFGLYWLEIFMYCVKLLVMIRWLVFSVWWVVLVFGNFVNWCLMVLVMWCVILVLGVSKIICEFGLCLVWESKLEVMKFGVVLLLVIISIFDGFVGILIVVLFRCWFIWCFVLVIKVLFGLKILFIFGIDFVLNVSVVMVCVLLMLNMFCILYSCVV